ncbi:DUF4956 domain-containing protein [Candidatus Falkowbacteria bacterium]|uniref:DUF4956 domain-containing protein n=1 Tax=Candidatus Buchananbacteria bacterium CG10_big_fil_rev_8_21_14_0_10_33_19 TaxID=1974525 RepID=A0A2H0W5C1_9BACT|nr:DUF4956 domain-containing protein [Candidatus Falkowbacteria bacterium]PIS05830.1 MAG: hypothetical protein COT80_03630 [Candidatus Buchananbacteria bacterium CG10_big_fil_rev_8_21_14_0_10_33_19]
MLENLIELPKIVTTLTVSTIVFNIVLAFVLSLIIAIVYRNTHKGLSYSQSFTFTLVLIGMLIAVIMMVIGNSLAIAFGAFGAFSLIRFRTAIKDTKDLSFILLVVSIGLAVGTNNYLIAIIVALLSSIFIYLMSKFNFGSIRKYDYLLNFSANHEEFSNNRMREIFDDFLKYDNLLNVVSHDNGRLLDYSFNIKFIKEDSVSIFVERLSKMNGVKSVNIVAAKNDIEY